MSSDRSVKDYPASLDEPTVVDSQLLIDLMQRISDQKPKLWNAGTIGFDTYHQSTEYYGRLKNRRFDIIKP